MRLPLILWTVALWAGEAFGDEWEDGFSPPGPFTLDALIAGNIEPGHATSPGSTGSRIAAVGDGALVVDADSGMLVRTDTHGKPIASLQLAVDAGLLAY